MQAYCKESLINVTLFTTPESLEISSSTKAIKKQKEKNQSDQEKDSNTALVVLIFS
jgi:hypothetical protein